MVKPNHNDNINQLAKTTIKWNQCSVCQCANCEHNALDEFWKRVDENAGIIMNLSKHRD